MRSRLNLSPLEVACDIAVIDNDGRIPASYRWPAGSTWRDMVLAQDRVETRRAEARAAEANFNRERSIEIHRRPAFTLTGADYLTLIIVGASVVTAVGYTIVLLLRGDHPWWG